MKQLIIFILLGFCTSLNAQQKSFDEVMSGGEWAGQPLELTKKQLDAYYAQHPKDKGSGYKQYQRWLYEMERHFSGNEVPFNFQAQNFSSFEEVRDTLSPTQNATSHNGFWNPLPIINHTTGRNTGRINCIAFHPTIANRVYAGTPAGGLYVSSDNGVSWSNLTFHFASLGISGIDFDPVNPNIIYVITGDGDAADSPSLGVYKTTDAGINWQVTGLSFGRTQLVRGRDVKVCPTNRNAIIACTSTGVFRSADAGVNWVQELVGNFYDIEFKPGSQTCYASSNAAIFYSTNAGDTWTSSSASPAISGGVRIELAVSPADPNLVCAMVAGTNFIGVFASLNSGASFLRRCSSPNLTSYPLDGSGTTGQTSYDLGICISPTNASFIFVSGINIWKSTNGGFSFGSQANAWYGGTGSKYVHEDNHSLVARSNTEIWTGCDGGIFKTTDGGNNWSFVSTNLFNSQYYHMDNYPGLGNYFMGGTQDNGGHKWDAGNFTPQATCCDAGAVTINYKRKNTAYMNGSNAYIYRTGNGFASTPDGDAKDVTPFIGCNCRDTLGAFIVEALEMHPTDTNTIYTMYRDLFVSNNRGNNWTRYPTGACCVARAMAIAPTNPAIIYAITVTNIQWTNNGGVNWYPIPSPPGINSGNYTDVEVDLSNPYHIWVSNGGYNTGYKLFEYTGNGGTTTTSWTVSNRSSGLPDVPVFCIEHDKTATDGIYIGTDIGVYFRNNSLGFWKYFGNGLPYASVRDLRFDAATETLTAATYGLGLWQSSIHGVCPSFVNHTPGGFFPFHPIGDDVLQAADSLRSSYYFQGGEGFNMKYTAGNRIRMEPGFGVKAGTTLKASIQGCNTAVSLQSVGDIIPLNNSGEIKNEDEPLVPENEKQE